MKGQDHILFISEFPILSILFGTYFLTHCNLKREGKKSATHLSPEWQFHFQQKIQYLPPEIASEAFSYHFFFKILVYNNFCALHGASALLPLP